MSTYLKYKPQLSQDTLDSIVRTFKLFLLTSSSRETMLFPPAPFSQFLCTI